MNNVEETKAEFAKKLAEAERADRLQSRIPELAPGLQAYAHAHELYGVSGIIKIDAGHFGKRWITIDEIEQFVSLFPALPLEMVRGDYKTILPIGRETNYKHKIDSRAPIAPFWLESHGIWYSNHLALNWLTEIEGEAIEIELALSPSLGFSIHCRRIEVMGGFRIEDTIPSYIVAFSPQLTKYARGSHDSMHSLRIHFEDATATISDYVAAIRAKAKK